MIEVRDEAREDRDAVRQVNELAFGRPNEAVLVDAIRRAPCAKISLVAVRGGRVVGHMLFSPVSIESEEGKFEALGLGPMAILPGCQRQGIGSELVRSGLEECRRLGHCVVVVLGHPHFYRCFGFRTAKALGLRSEYDFPEDVFMVAELEPGALRGRGGLVKYRPEFADV